MNTPRSLDRSAAILLLGFAVAVGDLAADHPARESEEVTERLSFSTGELEIPAFARKYRVNCNLCHMPFPKLTDFGNTFAGNGFQFSTEEQPRDTIDTGDPLLQLVQDIPFAVRFDGYAQGISDPSGEKVSNDLGFP